MKQNIKIFKNELTKFLAELVKDSLRNSLKIDNIEDAHHIFKDHPKLLSMTDQKTIIHKNFYKELDNEDSEINKSYRLLVEDLCRKSEESKNYNEWAIQRFPSLRVQFPNNLSVYEFHKDSDYSHHLGEANNFMAVTDCKESAALHIEKNLGWEDYKPLNLVSGELAQVNTSIFKHGDIPNQENYTRISIDFRFLPLKVLKKDPIGASITANKKMDESNYYYLYKY